MRPLTSSEIHGTWGTLLLPIAENDSIDWGRLGEEIDALIASGCDGIYSNGTAGEFYAQSEDEFDRVSELLASRSERAGMAFQLGASHMSPQTSLSRVRRAAALKPGAIQVILPDWYPVNRNEARAFLEKVAEAAAPVGLILYNPPHAKRRLAPAEFAALSVAVPALLGVKVANSDADWCGEFRRLAPRLSLFVPGSSLATGVKHGAHGAYSNVACLSPAGAKRWNGLMHLDLAKALEIEERIQSFLTRYILPFREERGVPNQGLDKLMAGIGGWAPVGTRLRWPYQWAPEEEALALRPVARAMLPELF